MNFDSFWEAYPAGPRRTNKKGCLEKWKLKKLDEKASEIVAHVNWSKRNNPEWRDGFQPAPMTYINQERWADGTFETRLYEKREAEVGPRPSPCDLVDYILSHKRLSINQIRAPWQWLGERSPIGVVIPSDGDYPSHRVMFEDMLT